MTLLFVLLFCLFIRGLPYALYRDSQKLDKPVVVFKANFWEEAPYLLGILVFLGMTLALAGVIVTRPTINLVAGLGAFALTLVSLGLGFVFLRLQLTYWLHDQHATLTMYTPQQLAEYRKEDVLVSFALADVVRITRYIPSIRGIYTYQVFTLRNGTELLLTCLMYSMLGPEELMPDVPRQTVRKTGSWLPGDELNFSTLF